MFTTALLLLVYSVFVQVCFSFLLCDDWRLSVSVNNLFPGQHLKVCSVGATTFVTLIRLANHQCTNRVEKKKCMEMNKHTFLFAFSFLKSPHFLVACNLQ